MIRKLVLVALVLVVCVVVAVTFLSVLAERPAPDLPTDPAERTADDERARPGSRGPVAPDLETVTGQVQAYGGRALAGVRVWVDGVETVTDARGRFEVAGRPRGGHRILAGGGDYRAEEVVVAPGGRSPTISLYEPAKREGLLELPEGVPLEGIDVTFRKRGGDVEQTVRTDETGAFVADRLRPYGHIVTIPSQRIGDRVFFRASALAKRFDYSSVRLVPQPGEVISGVVLAPGGAPVVGARVNARGRWPGTSVTHLEGSITDERGAFEVIVPAGVVSDLLAWAASDDGRGDRFAAEYVRAVTPPAGDVEIRLGAGHALRGELRDAADSAVVGAALEFRYTGVGLSHFPVVTAVTDRRGRFVVGGLREPAVRVTLADAEIAERGLLLREEVDASVEDERVVLTAVPSLRLRGRIVRPADLADHRITYGVSHDGGRVDAWRPLGTAGAFEIDRKPPGAYVVHVRVAKDDHRRCGTVEAGAEPVDLVIPPRE